VNNLLFEFALLIILSSRLIFKYMDTSRPLSITLFIYECMRLVFLTGVFMVLQPESETPFPWLALITPGALFFLMALFWLLHARYRLYYPLYLAGKGFSIVTFMFWIIFAGNDMIREMLYGKLARYIAPGAVFFLLLGDTLSVWTVLLIMKGYKNSDS
jgi:hypothetical protein